MRAHHRAAGAALLALAVALALAGCNGGEAEEGEGAAELSIDATEFAFDPADATAPADQDVEVTLDNTGTLEHEWVVLSSGTALTAEEEFSEDLVEFEVEAQAGETATAALNLPAGDYQVICGVPGHFASGMEGTLTVE